MLVSVVGVIGAIAATAGFAQSGAGEWRQWGGPHRNFVSDPVVADEGRLFTLKPKEAAACLVCDSLAMPILESISAWIAGIGWVVHACDAHCRGPK
jgi:hypothetical protein